MRIAFFDSGLGGLTVLHTAMKQLPQEDFLFYADTLHVPYGTKTKEEVKSYIHAAIRSILQEDVKAIVIACNTATSLAIAELRVQYDIPIIGMEPAVKPAVEMNRWTGKRTLVFATPLTLKESKYHDLLHRVDYHNTVDSVALPELVQYCEALEFNQEVIHSYFRRKLEGLCLEDYGTVVLGCTHYPFYTNLLKEILPKQIQIIDGRVGTVNRLKGLLSANQLLSSVGNRDVKFLSSCQTQEMSQKLECALSMFIEAYQK